MAKQSQPEPPLLENVRYLLDGEDPKDLWRDCVKNLDDWKAKSSNETALGAMRSYKKQRALNLVWVDDELRDHVSEGVNEKQTYKVLEEIYDDDDRSTDLSCQVMSTDAEKDRKTVQQLTQQMRAYKLLCCSNLEMPLTVDLIKTVHEVLMANTSVKGQPILAGKYRETQAHAGDHVFPTYEIIPREMDKVVNEYNTKFSTKHDMYALASWLLYQFVTLHPFEDGNGRMCRLLWCYSLMKDDLPFPVTLSSGHKTSHKHYVKQILGDRRVSRRGQPRLTTLTVIAVSNAWINFFEKLRFEHGVETFESID